MSSKSEDLMFPYSNESCIAYSADKNSKMMTDLLRNTTLKKQSSHFYTQFKQCVVNEETNGLELKLGNSTDLVVAEVEYPRQCIHNFYFGNMTPVKQEASKKKALRHKHEGVNTSFHLLCS